MNKIDLINIVPSFTNNHIKASFSLSCFSSSKQNDRLLFAQKTGFNHKNLIIPIQTHSPNIAFCSTPRIVQNCDGVFTDNHENVCSIKVADCMPIFFGHCTIPVFGVIHVGWRGLTNGIIQKVSSLFKSKDYNLNDFEIVIGPSIRSCCFEVKQDIINKFNNNFIISNKGDSYNIDLQSNAHYDLVDAGFDGGKIYSMKNCTYCDGNKFHSYRRDGKDSGRMIGLIGIK